MEKALFRLVVRLVVLPCFDLCRSNSFHVHVHTCSTRVSCCLGRRDRVCCLGRRDRVCYLLPVVDCILLCTVTPQCLLTHKQNLIIMTSISDVCVREEDRECWHCTVLYIYIYQLAH